MERTRRCAECATDSAFKTQSIRFERTDAAARSELLGYLTHVGD